jgi:Xaa-Pro dipeptidase
MERPFLLLIVPGRTPALVLPELEARKIDDLPFALQAFPYGENPADWGKAFAAAVQAAGGMVRVGVEAGQMRLLESNYLREAAPGIRLVTAEKTLARLRMYKDESELAAMRRAAGVAQRALQATLPLVKFGMTEQELAGELVVQLLWAGSSPRVPFAPIVSAGPNSANPHATPTDRKLAPGDLLLFDWGAAVDDYFSDITRTFALGAVDAEYARIHDLVRQANEAGRAAGAPGVPMSAVDKAARSVISDAGYGQYFTHRTGHGLGMEGHEEPYIRGDNEQLLEPGMTFTIEPGIYLPGRGGVRIEDDVVVTATGLDSLTDLPRRMITLPG